MSLFRTQLSAFIVWGMIPLAVYAGLPSTGCLCANGQFKFFCSHRYQSVAVQVLSGRAAGCAEEQISADCSCCSAAIGAEHEDDCCQHGGALPGNGIQSQRCCQPVLSAPNLSWVVVASPSDRSLCLTVCHVETGAIAHSAVAVETIKFDTGPPLDRVVAFRHLLI